MAEYTNYNVVTRDSLSGVVGGLGSEVLAPCSWVNKKASMLDGLVGGYVDVLGAKLLLSVTPVRYTELDSEGVLVGGARVQNSFGLAGLEGASGVLGAVDNGVGGNWGASGSWGVLGAEYLVDMVVRRASKSKFAAGLGMTRDLVDLGIAGDGPTYKVGSTRGGVDGDVNSALAEDVGAAYCVLVANPAVLGAVASAVEGQKAVDMALMAAAKATSDAVIEAIRASSAAAVAKMAESQLVLGEYAGVVSSVEAARKALVTGDCGIDSVTGSVRGDLLTSLAYSVGLGEAARDKALVGFESTLGFEGVSHVSGTLYSGGNGVPRVVRLYDQDSGELVASVFSTIDGKFRFNGVAPGEYFVTSNDLGMRDPTFAIRGVMAK